MIQFELDHALDFHQHWLRDHRFGRCADFTDKDLRDLNAKSRDMSGALLEGANVFNCDFTGANLTGVIAAGGHFMNCNFTDTIFKNANFTNTRFTDCTFENTDLWGVTGNAHQIITLQIGKRTVVYTDKMLQLSCKQYPLETVWEMTDDEVLHSFRGKEYDGQREQNLEWWRTWKPLLQQIITENPALKF